MLCDTNILIYYAAEPGDMICAPFVDRSDAIIASVSRIEVLGFPGFRQLPVQQQDRLQEIISSLVEAPLDEAIIQRAIILRSRKK